MASVSDRINWEEKKKQRSEKDLEFAKENRQEGNNTCSKEIIHWLTLWQLCEILF